MKTKTNPSFNLYSQILSKKTLEAKTLDRYWGCVDKNTSNFIKITI